MAEVVAFYARVSTEEQRKRATIENQLAAARQWAASHGVTIELFSDDGLTGMKPFAERPGGAALIAAARTGRFRTVATAHMNRFGRDQLEILLAKRDLERLGLKLVSLSEPFEAGTPYGDAAAGYAAVNAQLDRAMLLQRMRDGKLRVAGHDYRWIAGVVPYGYSMGENHTLAVDADEADVIRRIYAWAIEGWTHGRIASQLNSEGIAARSDRPHKRRTPRRNGTTNWYRVQVSRILRAELYSGRASFFRASRQQQLVQRDVPAIVSPATFLAARKAVDASKHFQEPHNKRHDYVLRGIVRCGLCGHTITGRGWGAVRKGYYCQHCPKSERAFLDEPRLVNVIWADIVDFLDNPDQTLRAIAQAAGAAGVTEDRVEGELLEGAQRLRELEQQEMKLVEIRLAGVISSETLDRKARQIVSERGRIRLEMQALRAERSAAAHAVEESARTRGTLKQLGQLVRRAQENSDQQKAIIRLVTKAIQIHWAAGQPRVHIRYAFGRPEKAAPGAGLALELNPRSTSRPALGRPSEHRAR